MYFSLDAALDAHPSRAAQRAPRSSGCCPGPVLAVLPGGHGSAGARAGWPRPRAPGVAVLQTSANLTGGPDPRRLADVPAAIRDGADLVLDGGELPGVPSTVVDLSSYESR